MSEKNNPSVGYTVSLCGIMSGLALALMFMLGMVPTFEYVSPAAAGVLIWVIREQLGVKYGLISYVAVSILCFLITMNYEASMMFLFLLGYYPTIRDYFQKIRFAPLRFVLKMALYAVSAVGAYMLLIHLFGMEHLLDDANEFGKYGTLILLCMGALAFVVYDLFLGVFAQVFAKLIKPKIRRRMR